MKQYKKIKLVYIMAASHSGSTLLAFLLGAHPEIFTVGELKLTSIGNPDDYRCSCREFIKVCPFWKNVQRCMAEKGHPFDIENAGTDLRSGGSAYVKRLLRPLHRGRLLEAVRDIGLYLSPSWRKNFPAIQSRNLALIECISVLSGKNIIVDSSKIGIRLKYLLQLDNIDLKVIRLIRDGRGVALTYMDPERFADAQDPALRGGGTGKSRDAQRLSVPDAVLEWKRSNEEAEQVLGSMDSKSWIKVHYEDLCCSTESTLRRIFEFIGTKIPEPKLDFKNVDHHVVGNGMRLDTSNEIILDERWKTRLSRNEKETFEKVAGELNRRLGYAS